MVLQGRIADGEHVEAALGDIQRARRNGDSIPIHGGSEHGIFNYINSPYSASGGGYPDTIYGSSFVITATFDGIGQPRAESILTYSLSTDPTSPWFGDQTWLYSAKQWVPMHMTQADVAANVVIPPYTVSG